MARLPASLTSKLERFCELKAQMKALETEVKALQGELIEDPRAPDKYDGPLGTLTYVARDNWKFPEDNDVLIKAVGLRTFKKAAKVSKTELVKQIGEIDFERLVEEEVVNAGKPTEFYQFKAHKKPKEPGKKKPALKRRKK